MKLTIKQTISLDYLEDNKITELIFGGGAGGGKSAFGCYWALKLCLKYAGIRGLIGRSQLKILKETTLVTFFEICSKQGLRVGVDYTFNAQSSIIHFYNGSQILLKDLYLYPSDPNFDSLGSLEISFAFIDECNQLSEKAWNITMSRIRFKLDEFGIIPKILGTCNPSKNWVYRKFYKPSKTGELLENIAFVQSLATDNPYISQHYIENLKKIDNVSKQRLLYGNWEYDSDPRALISYDAICDLFTNIHVQHGKKYITADIARFGKDKTVIMVWSGWKLMDYKILNNPKVTESAEAIRELRLKHAIPASQIIVDEDGVGGGVVDILGCKGFVNNARPKPNKEAQGVEMQGTSPKLLLDRAENFDNLKSQCGFYLADEINNGNVDLSIIDNVDIKEAITEELEQIKQKDVDSDGKKRLMPKDEVKEFIGRSPDYSDCMLMRKYFDLFREITPVRTTMPNVRRPWKDENISLLT
jgi:hypothetical protein